MQQYPDTGLPPQGGQGMQFAQTADADQNLQQQGTQAPQAADTLASARRPAKYRHEHKYEISLFEFLSLSKLLQTVMQPDPHANQDGQYLITSLYFDNCFDKALREKKDGLNQREKFRLRYYGSTPDKIFLEKKQKHAGLCLKSAAPMTHAECQRLLSGQRDWMLAETARPLLAELAFKMQTQLLRPRTVVRYSRVPFIYAPGNVRVTFDCNLCTGLSADAFLDDAALALCSSPARGGIILEVKYDEFLPDVIRTVVQPYCSRLQAFSKYAQCRSYG